MELTPDQKQQLRENQCIIFTDLDGTFLGHEAYDLGEIPEVLQKLQVLNIPVIFNTSKTWEEVQILQQQLDYFYPSIVENGGGIHVPTQSPWLPSSLINTESEFMQDQNNPSVRDALNKCLDEIGRHFQFQRMRDWSAEEVAFHTSLTLENAMHANRRLYSEPLLWQDTDTHLVQLTELVRSKGLRLVRGGRFCHLMGQHDKSTMMTKVVEAYKKDFGQQPLIIALGDSQNDVQMLEKADIACVLTLPGRQTLALSTASKQQRVYFPHAPAPHGWVESIEHILAQKA